MFFCKALIVAMTVSGFLVLLFQYYTDALFYYKGNIILAFLYAVVFITFSFTYGCFRIGINNLREIIFSYALSVLLTNFIFYFVLSLIAKKMFNPVPILALTGSQWLFSTLMYYLFNKLYFRLYPARDTLIICTDHQRDMEMIWKFHRMKEQYDIRMVVHESEGYDRLIGNVDRYSTIILGNIDSALRTRLITYCFEQNKRLYIVPAMQDIMLNNAKAVQIKDSLIYLCKNNTFSLEELAIKRLIDITVSFVGLILLSPVILATAIAIKLQDGGSVFFKQCRLTRNGAEFDLIKFRSMVEDAEKGTGARFASKNDNRITRVGRFIRMTRIDEIPQLINILKGEMSLVGPRPERPEIFEKNCKVFPQFHYRLKVKAGLTGYAQIFGKYNTTFEDKVKMDLLYIENFSLIMDLRLMFSTFKVLFMRESTEGFEDSIQPNVTVLAKERPLKSNYIQGGKD